MHTKTLHKKYLAHIVLCTKILGRTSNFHKKAPLTQSTLHKKHLIQKILSAQTLYTIIKFAQNAIILQCCQMGCLYTTMVVYTTIWPKWSYFGRLFNLKVVFHQKLVIFWSPFHSLHYNVDVYFR